MEATEQTTEQTTQAPTEQTAAPATIGTATYSPEDNKLRLYPDARLSSELYARVKAAGFSWAPQQKLFYAPMWTPAREDLLIELCGEVGDEDTSLVDRAEERAERFEGYQENRAKDADRAHAAVSAIADNIPFGQPILVGHHSERHARKDAEKIENGMRKAVKMWETSKYWEQRAAGALHHAKYKELPAVRARRIKGLQADLRRCEAAFTPCKGSPVVMQPRWNAKGENPPRIAHVLTGQGRAKHYTPVEDLPRIKAGYMRWMAHFHNRIIYETAMLNEQGAGALIAPKPRPKQLPLLNYKVDSLPVNHYGREEVLKMIDLTAAQFKAIGEDYRGTRAINGTHRVRSAIVKVDEAGNYVARGFPGWKDTAHVLVFLTDSKSHTPPDATAKAPAKAPTPAPRREYTPRPVEAADPTAAKFEGMAQSLRAGVKVVAAPQLFPTPDTLARRVADLAGIMAGQRVLEPSAGTGNLLRQIQNCFTGADCGKVTAIEINFNLAEQLRAVRDKTLYANESNYDVRCSDFLECTPADLGTFHRIVMNPPFENGADIKHIQHARTFLKPGGKLVAICANGPRQRDQLMPLASEWIDLERGAFAQSGTMVNAAICIIDA